MHLFSASPELVGFAQSVYRQRSAETSLLLRQLFERFREEGLTMSYTMQDFKRDYIKKHLLQLPPEERRDLLQSLPPEERRDLLQSLPPEERLAGLSAEQIRAYLERLTAGQPEQPRRSRRKK